MDDGQQDATQGRGEGLEAWLVLVLGRRLSWGVLSGALRSSLRVGAEEYLKVSSSEFDPFVDRLYNEKGTLVGFGIATLVDSQSLAGAVASLPYIEALRTKGLFRIFLRKQSGVITALPDQAFGGGIFESFRGLIAVVVPTRFLTDSDIDQLPNADWIAVDGSSR